MPLFRKTASPVFAVCGAYTGNYNDMVELIELAKKGVIKPVISKRYSIDEANEALENLKARKIIGRAVINP